MRSGHPCSRIGETEEPSAVIVPQSRRQRSAVRHGANSVITDIPENLLQAVRVSDGERTCYPEIANDIDGHELRFVCRGLSVLQKPERVLENCGKIDMRELVLLLARVHQEIRNDAVETFRLAVDDIN